MSSFGKNVMPKKNGDRKYFTNGLKSTHKSSSHVTNARHKIWPARYDLSS